MTRSAVVVRSATEQDLPTLLTLLDEMPVRRAWRHPRAAGFIAPWPVAADVEQRLRVALSRPDHRVVLVTVDGEPAGLAVLGLEDGPWLASGRSLAMRHVLVCERLRRRGAGAALAAAAAAFADELGVDAVTVDVPPADREANRYYARMGFAPVATTRLAPVSALRRRLGASDQVKPVDPAQVRSRLRGRANPVQARVLARRRELPRVGGS